MTGKDLTKTELYLTLKDYLKVLNFRGGFDRQVILNREYVNFSNGYKSKKYRFINFDSNGRRYGQVLIWEHKETDYGHRPTYEEFLKFYGLDIKSEE